MIRRRCKPDTVWVALVLAAIVLAVVAAATLCLGEFRTETHTGCTVQEKDLRVPLKAGNERAPRVYTTCGTFRIADVAVQGHFSSGDTYGRLRVGQTYDLTTAGLRVPLLSTFPSVIEVKPSGK